MLVKFTDFESVDLLENSGVNNTSIGLDDYQYSLITKNDPFSKITFTAAMDVCAYWLASHSNPKQHNQYLYSNVVSLYVFAYWLSSQVSSSSSTQYVFQRSIYLIC